MSQNPAIRWQQRLQSLGLAFSRLSAASNLASTRPLTELEQQGLIQAFEFTHELAWKTLKDYLEAQGFVSVIGSRDASRLAAQNGLIADGQIWMNMIAARNLSSHTYNEKTAREISAAILADFVPQFRAMLGRFSDIKTREP